MTDSATVASRPESTKPNILQRLEAYAEENPLATEYQLTDELEAEELLGAMAVMLRSMAEDVKHKADAKVLHDYARTYHQQVKHRTALNYIRGLTEDDELVFCGMKLVVPVILLQ